tara:strand:+ start:416 stop:610 length:195 start_codon:yes stop_codon:yes gene_type:complete
MGRMKVTNQQVYWAMQHNWFITTIERRMVSFGDVVNVIIVRCDVIGGKTISFTDFNKLKEWAGY